MELDPNVAYVLYSEGQGKYVCRDGRSLSEYLREAEMWAQDDTAAVHIEIYRPKLGELVVKRVIIETFVGACMSKYDDSIRNILEGAKLPHNCTIRYFAQTVSDEDKIKLARVLLESCQNRTYMPLHEDIEVYIDSLEGSPWRT